VSRVREEAGYSMIEMLVVLAILGVVLGGLTTIFVSGSRADMDMNRRFQAQQNARLSMARLRADLHLGGCVGTGTNATSITIYASSAAPGSCSGTATVTWCTAASASLTGRWTLYRQSGASCASNTGTPIADYLATNGIFTTNAPTTGSGRRTSVTVTIPVSTNTTNASLDRYTLTDSIVLRNSPQA
jgi:prepilin-type N-terminal cleavage/methylation domain-containing protein